MMDDTVKRSSVIALCEGFALNCKSEGHNAESLENLLYYAAGEAAARSIIEGVKYLQAADVRSVVRGKWREIGKTGRIFVCSACDKTFPYKTRYCPNCGADTREEE